MYTRTYVCTLDPALGSSAIVGLIIRRVYTRATIGGVEGHREGGEGPAEPIKQVPDLYPSLPHPARSPRRATPRHSRGPKTRGQYQGSSLRGSIVPPSLPPSLLSAILVPSSSCRHFVDPFARFVPGQARLARSRVPSPVRLSVPLPDRRPVHCTTAASVQCGRARKRVLRGFRYLDSRE